MTTTQAAPFDELTATLRGELITTTDPRYIDKRPAAITCCVADAEIEVHRRYGELLPHRPLDDAPVPDRRRGGSRPGGRNGVPVPGRWMDRPGSGERRADHAVDAGLLDRTAPDVGRRNFLMDEGGDRVRAAHRGNYERLVQVKGRYDPENDFHVNQDIKPAEQRRTSPTEVNDLGGAVTCS